MRAAKGNISRIVWVDYLKVFAILLVLMGHCIQFGNGADYYCFNNRIYIWIYSFHMPLFAIISGYFLHFSVSKKLLGESLRSKIMKILVPIISWQFVINLFWCARSVYAAIVGNMERVTLKNILGMLFAPYRYLYANMWFLWAVLVCSCLIVGVKHWFHDSILAYGILILMTWLIPVYEVQLMVWLLPFFIAGYFGGGQKASRILNDWILLVSLAVHIGILLEWRSSIYIYNEVGATLYIFGEQCSIVQHIIFNLIRILSGISGSYVVISVFYKMRKWMCSRRLNAGVQTIAKYSMSIYVSSVYMFNQFLRDQASLNYNLGRNVMQTVVILIASVFVSDLLYKNSITRAFFYGTLGSEKNE